MTKIVRMKCLIIPAEKVDDKAINFMATHGRGLICLSLTEERVKELTSYVTK